MSFKLIFLIALFLTISTISLSTRPEPTGTAQPKPIKSNTPGEGFPGGFFGPGGGFNIPSGWAGGYGAGYGGPKGGYSKSGVIRPSVVCSERGPCHKKKLTCPAKCFSSYSHSGKSYGSGGGGGGCTMDCKKCVAYC